MKQYTNLFQRDFWEGPSAIPTPVKERTDLDLLELVCQLHSRALQYPSEGMHNAYVEARTEMESRLKKETTVPSKEVSEGDRYFKHVMGELEKIVTMKREPGEITDQYAFNRCWHIASDLLGWLSEFSTVTPSPSSTVKEELVITQEQFYKIKDLILECIYLNLSPADCFDKAIEQKIILKK